MHTYLVYISDHMHQVEAGSGGNSIDLLIALLSTGTNEEYIQPGFGFPQTQYQSVEHYLQLMENPTTYATHTEIVAANQFIIVQHPRATDIGWSTLSITTKRKHM